MSRQFNEHYFEIDHRYLVDYPEEYIFIPVKDAPGYYVCEEGYVMHNGKILRDHPGDNHGHLSTRLYVNGKIDERYTHRIVAEAWVPNPNNHPIVRHLNDVPYDNRVENLAWGTQRDNHEDAVRNRSYVPISEECRRKSIEATRRPVRVTDIYTGEIEDFYSLNDACRSKGIIQANACKVLRGERRKANGYFIEYLEKEVVYDE